MSVALPSTEIWHRDDFPTLATWRKYQRVIEVGVDRAEYTAMFLSRWINGRVYLGVDPYVPYPEMPFNRDGDFHTAVHRTAQYGRCFKLLKESWETVAKALRDDHQGHHYSYLYQFIYIDGNHVYADVLRDMRLAWHLLSEDGMLAGHDWSDPGGLNKEVQPAVIEFARSVGRDVYYTLEDSEPTSWYLYKTLSPSSDWKRC